LEPLGWTAISARRMVADAIAAAAHTPQNEMNFHATIRIRFLRFVADKDIKTQSEIFHFFLRSLINFICFDCNGDKRSIF
jgi:hypothetical protein